MALSFSKPLKEGIIKEWLRGKNRDTIAHENGLSTGTVSNVVREWKEEIGSLSADQLREFAVTLRKCWYFTFAMWTRFSNTKHFM